MAKQQTQRKLNLVGSKAHSCSSLQIGDTTLAIADLQELGRPEAKYTYGLDYDTYDQRGDTADVTLKTIETTCPCTSIVFVQVDAFAVTLRYR